MFMLLHHVGPRVELVTVPFPSILERQVHPAPDLYVTRIILGAFLIYDQMNKHVFVPLMQYMISVYTLHTPVISPV
jgi:hypothetical protein